MRNIRPDAKIKSARRLRKALSKPELWLWLRLRPARENGLVFRNQHPLGPYILDFYCAKARLCIEVDGEIHTHEDRRAHDAVRDRWLIEHGIHVHRIHAVDLLTDPDETALGVITLALELKAIIEKAESRRPLPPPDGGSPSP